MLMNTEEDVGLLPPAKRTNTAVFDPRDLEPSSPVVYNVSSVSWSK